MKRSISLFILAASLVAFAADTQPRIVSLASGPHPKAQIVMVDSATGTLLFSYLKADGTKADSGNSVARFTPQAEPVSDATLAAAILSTQ